MEIIKAKDINKYFFKDSIFVYPTETAYGLGACSLNENLLEKIYKIKQRPKNKVFPLIAASLSQVQTFFYLSKKERELADKYWAGPLTLLLRPKREFPKILLGLEGRIGVRVSSNPFAQLLSKKCAQPIVATSANLSGKTNLYKISDIIEEFENSKNQPDFIIDDGDLKEKSSSTIVMVEDESCKILRQGDIQIK